jgi:aquaporin Z
MLCFVVLNVAVASKVKPNEWYGLAIGFVIIAGAYGAGPVSGGCFNPAVAIGIDTSSAGIGFGWCAPYTLVELFAAACAAFVFKAVRPNEFTGNAATDAVPMSAKLLSEFLGTFMLVLTVGLNVNANSPAGAFSIAASLMCMIYALGSVSGAHFNPAVSVAIFASGLVKRNEFSSGDMGKYIGVQILGGICASFTYKAIYQGHSFPLEPQPGFKWPQVAVAEIIFTFVLCYIVLCVAVAHTKSTEMFGLAIGSCVTVGGFAIGSISGGSLNPAVSLGIASSHSFASILCAFAYCLFEFLGAGVAATLVKVTHAEEEDPKIAKV